MNYKFGILILVLLSFAACTFDDDGRFISLTIQDAITIEKNQNLIVGDTVFIALSFSRFLDEEGFSNQLDVYESTDSDAFRYDFQLQKFSELSDGFQPVQIASEFLFAENGAITNFGGTTAVLNEDKTRYESRIGLVLAESGRFLLDFEFLNLSSTNFSEDRVQIDIQHFFVENQSNFEFTVEN